MIRFARSALVALAAATVALGLTFSTATAGVQSQLPAGKYDDQIAEAEKKKAKLKEQEEELDHQLEDTSADIVEANKRLRELNARLPEAQKELELAEERLWSAQLELEIAENKLTAAEQEDARLSEQIADDEARIGELTALVAELARSQYRGEDSSATLRLVFGSATTEDFVSEFSFQHTIERTQGNALAMIEEIAAANRNRGIRQEAVRDYAELLREDAKRLVKETNRARKAAEAFKAEIEAGLAEQEEIKAYLLEQKKEFLKDLRKIKRERVQTQLELALLTRKQFDDNLQISDGVFKAPVSPIYVTSSFGYRIHPIYGVRIFHAGVDLRAPCGTPIRATTAGIVVYAKYNGGHGNQVLVKHGTIKGHVYTSTYNHMSKFNKKADDIVLPGDVLGYSGSTGSSTACHLHFEITRDGKYMDPMGYI